MTAVAQRRAATKGNGAATALSSDPAALLANAGILRCDQVPVNEAWGKFGFTQDRRVASGVSAAESRGMQDGQEVARIPDGFGGLTSSSLLPNRGGQSVQTSEVSTFCSSVQGCAGEGMD